MSRIKQCLVEGFCFAIPGFGSFIRRNNSLYFMPDRAIDDILKGTKQLDKIVIEKRKGKIKRGNSN
jgi:hypothetical protein